MSGIVARTRPPFVTPDHALQMAHQVVMCCAESGHPDVTFKPTNPPTLFEQEPLNYDFAGAPRDVIYRAGELIRSFWNLESE